MSGFKILNKVIPRAQTSIPFMSSRVAEVNFPLSKTISGAIYGFVPRSTLDVCELLQKFEVTVSDFRQNPLVYRLQAQH